MRNEEIMRLLSDKGLKCTRQRLDVLHALADASSPMSADMIFSKLSRISLSTVYRILEKFTECSIVTRDVCGKGSEIYYELACMSHRHYAVCLGCHEVRYVESCPVHKTRIDGFTVTGHRLELYGYCSKCSTKNNHELQ